VSSAARKPSFLRKHLTAIVLSVCVVLAAVVTFVLDRDSLTTGESEARKGNLLPAWRGDDIVKLEVTSEGESYVLTRAPKGEQKRVWDLAIDGKAYPAEEQTVDRLLSTLEYAKFAREVQPTSVNRDEAGLASPRTTIAITMGELKFLVALGGPAATGEGVYVEVEGRGVYVITTGLAAALIVPSADLRSRSLVPYMSTSLAGLWLEGEGGTRRFERAEWGGGRGSGFRFAEGSQGTVGDRVDGAQLDQVLVAFGKMQADAFLDEQVASVASKPRVTVTMVPRDGAPSELAVGGACPDRDGFIVVVRRSPEYLAACVPEAVIQPLLKPAAEFEDDGIVGANVDEIVELSIQQGDKSLEIARYGPGFKVRKPEEREIDAETGNGLLMDIVSARGDRAPPGTAPPSGDLVKVRIKSQGGIKEGGGTIERTEDLEVGPLKDGKHLILRKEDGALIFIGDAAASVLRPSDLLLRDVDVVDISTLDIEDVSIEHGNEKQRFSRAESSYSLLLPKGKGLRADDGFAGSAVTTLAKLSAKRWVAEEPTPAFGLSTPRFTISATISKDPQAPERPISIKLLLGARTDDGTYATVSTQKGVFLVEHKVEETFDRSFIARDAFAITTATADQIEIQSGSKRVKLVRDGRQLRLEGGSETRAAELEKALSQLMPIRALSSGPSRAEQGLAEPSLKIKITRRKGSTDDAALPSEIQIGIGVGDTFDGVGIRYARRDDVDATFLVPIAAASRLVSLTEAP